MLLVKRHHFYKIRSNTYLIKNKIVLYGIHEETGIIPLKSLNEQDLNINIITITSTTTESKEYAIRRGIICYGQDYQAWDVYVDQYWSDHNPTTVARYIARAKTWESDNTV